MAVFKLLGIMQNRQLGKHSRQIMVKTSFLGSTKRQLKLLHRISGLPIFFQAPWWPWTLATEKRFDKLQAFLLVKPLWILGRPFETGVTLAPYRSTQGGDAIRGVDGQWSSHWRKQICKWVEHLERRTDSWVPRLIQTRDSMFLRRQHSFFAKFSHTWTSLARRCPLD